MVSARELSLKEIREIRDHIPEDMEIESFIHGAMCISYSGRCLFKQLFYRPGRQPGSLYPSLPVEVFSGGGPGPANTCRSMKTTGEPFIFNSKGSLYDRARSGDDRSRHRQL